MARKNNIRADHPGAIHFDSRTRTVMAEVSQENIKEKVLSVREVVPGKSNNEIVLVLQYYDYNVEKAIQAYLEDGAKEALDEWHMPSAKPNKKKKNKKKSSGPVDSGAVANAGSASSASTAQSPLPPRKKLAQLEDTISASSSVVSVSTASHSPSLTVSVSASGSKIITRSPLPNGHAYVEAAPPVVESVGDVKPKASLSGSSQSRVQNHPHHSSSGTQSHAHHGHSSQRVRTASERSNSNIGAGGDHHHKKPFQGLERAVKDLQRQTTSLERLRLVLDHEMDRSYKSLKTVFEEMRTHLNVREHQLLNEMDVVKQQANDVFKMRQERAAALKVQIERAEKMTEAELTELRLDVKHFVSDRKVDEELGRTTRFHYDSDHMKEEIFKFGEVLPVKCVYTARRLSVSSIASSGVGNDEAVTPPHLATDSHDMPVHDGSHMTTDEMAELQTRLKNSLKIQGFIEGKESSQQGAKAASEDDESRKSKNSRRRNRNRERQEQRRNEEGGQPVQSSNSPGVAQTNSSLQQQQPDRSPGSPLPQDHQVYNHMPPRSRQPMGRGGGNRGRGRGGPVSSGYRGGYGQNRTSPRRPYSGSGYGSSGRGSGGGGSYGSGEPSQARRFRGPAESSHRSVYVLNGTAN